MLEAVLSRHSPKATETFPTGRSNPRRRAAPPLEAATEKRNFLRAEPVYDNREELSTTGLWRYALPHAAGQATEDLRVHLTTHAGSRVLGLFACARGRHVDVLRWPETNAIIVAAASAVYIVNPEDPQFFSGIPAPVEIKDITFDETGEHMFVADSLRVYAFAANRTFQWISEPLEGYDAHFRGCGGRVLAVELKQAEPQSEGEEPEPSLIRLRTEDGTILRSRFRTARRYWLRTYGRTA